ncbi:MAG TPA: hypothetical protein VEU95_01515 [Micropepsaceae bacterium]|nr:hypothetical protein [Micropepsaceae bacterium]
MTNSFERACTYSYRAEELRAIADDLRDEEQRQLLREIAQEYEKMSAKFLGLGLAPG